MNLSEKTEVTSIALMLSCSDVSGKKCEQVVAAYDLSQQGARLEGIRQLLSPGTRVTLQYEDIIAAAQIVWVLSGKSGVCQAGVRLFDPKRCPWRSLLPGSKDILRVPDRRRAERYKLSVGLQLSDEVHGAPMQATTADIGVSGCYVETLFPAAVGARLKILLWLGPAKLLAKGIVRASYPGVGMGIEFLDLSWEETERLYRFLEAKQGATG